MQKENAIKTLDYFHIHFKKGEKKYYCENVYSVLHNKYIRIFEEIYITAAVKNPSSF